MDPGGVLVEGALQHLQQASHKAQAGPALPAAPATTAQAPSSPGHDRQHMQAAPAAAATTQQQVELATNGQPSQHQQQDTEEAQTRGSSEEPQPMEATDTAPSDGDAPAAAAGRSRKRNARPLPIILQNKAKQRSKSRSVSADTSKSSSSSSLGGGSSGEASDSERSSSSHEREEEVVLERSVSEQQYKQDEQTLKGMPELALICEFLFQFRRILDLETPVTYHSLVDALITSPGPGMLQQLHTELLRAVVSTQYLDEHTWAHYLALKLQSTWDVLTKPGSLDGSSSSDEDGSSSDGEGKQTPFKAEKHHELRAYAALSARNRVLALKALCDLRLEREDLRSMLADSATAAATGTGSGGRDSGAGVNKPPLPGRASRSSAAAAAAKEAEGELLPAELLRREPLGVDGSGFTYWWLDWCEGHVEGGANMGFMLARESPAKQAGPAGGNKRAGKAASPSPTKPAKGGASKPAAKQQQQRHRYKLPPLPGVGAWEVVAVSLEELEAFGAKLGRSLRAADKRVAEQVNSVLVPELKSRLEDAEKWRRAKERTRKMLGLNAGLMLDDGPSGRSQRSRKQVNYTDSAFDKMMKSAIRAANGPDDSPPQPKGRCSSKARGTAAGSDSAEDERPVGRRGRSRGSTEDLIALDIRARLGAHRRPAKEAAVQQEAEKDEQEQVAGSAEEQGQAQAAGCVEPGQQQPAQDPDTEMQPVQQTQQQQQQEQEAGAAGEQAAPLAQ